ncbi:MAG: cytochrome P450 [Methylobacteriaceae bacterium]|nr:cytochrome P450 [Methylobacteriaceae bacterium]
MQPDSAIALPPPRARRPRPPAPIPRERPLGTLGFLAALRRNPLETWTREHFEEPIVVREAVIGRRAVVNDPDAVRRILIDNAANYRKDALQRRLLAPGLGQGLLMAEGAAWRQQRRALAPLFTPKMVESFIPAMTEAAGRLVERWQRHRDGRVIEIGAEMRRVTLQVLERTIFSDGLERDPEAFAHNVTRYFDTFGRIDPLDILGVPEWVPRLGRVRGRRPLRFFDEAVEAIIAARRRRLGGERASIPHDLLTLLMEATDPQTGQGLSEAEIRTNIITFIGAGHETTANALTWSLFLVASEQEVRARLEAEADRELASGAPLGSIEGLSATRAVVEEAMRLYPPAPILTREAIAADDLAGVRIRPGTMVVIAPWLLHRHRLLWTEPDLFAPWRFLPERRGEINRFAYLPFGAGPRVCIGAAFALQEAVIVLATILRAFRLDVVPGHRVVPVQRVTLRPQGGMPMSVQRRA